MILGKTQTDQNWIDGEVEAGIGGCGYPRPAPRPEGLDAPATRQRPAIRTSELSPKKKGFIRRLKERVVPEQPQALQPAAPVVVYPSSPPPPPSPAAPVEAPRPDPVLDFLRPRKTT